MIPNYLLCQLNEDGQKNRQQLAADTTRRHLLGHEELVEQ
jgi:hypothetical protein